jgi:hypothetical protein
MGLGINKELAEATRQCHYCDRIIKKKEECYRRYTYRNVYLAYKNYCIPCLHKETQDFIKKERIPV